MIGTTSFVRRGPLPSADDAGSNGDRPPKRGRRAAWAALALAMAAAGWVVFAWPDGDGRPRERRAAAAGATATVTRRTLVERETVSGTLGYSDTRTVIHRLGAGSSSGDGRPSGGGATGGDSPESPGGSGAGDDSGDGSSPNADSSSSSTLTRIAPPGSLVRRGEPLYWVDGVPVLLMYGSMPAYRTLEQGATAGPDVRQLEENLAALGFDPGTVDEEFSSATAAAVHAWQEAAGVEETGRVELGAVAFLPGQRRAGARKAAVGQPLSDGQEVLETTSMRRLVEIELDVAKQSLVRRGDGVEVTLPGGATVRGRITRVGRVAHAASGDDAGGSPGAEGGSGDQELVIDVSVALRSQRRIGRLNQAPVTVAIASEKRRNALVVPVHALLARRGGGYAVELAASGRIVRVRTGLFADGLVEVSGGGLHEGSRVVVPE